MSKPRVMLLGDSIRLDYQNLVAEQLADRAEFVWPRFSGRHALYTLSSIPDWIAEHGRPDIVHWNNGAEDAGYNPRRSPRQIPLKDYAFNVQMIAYHILSNVTAKLIFATSTPPHPERPFTQAGWSWKRGDVEQYNDAAIEALAEYPVRVNDLYAQVRPLPDHYLGPDQLHLSEAGRARCATAVAAAVDELL